MNDQGHFPFPQLQKLFNYVFPKSGGYNVYHSNKLFRIWVRLAPFIALLCILVISIWGLLPTFLGYSEGTAVFFFTWHGLATLFALIAFSYLLFYSLILKLTKRSPALLLAATPILPFKILLIMVGLHFFCPVDQMEKEYGIDTAIYKFVQKEYLKENKEPYPDEKFFGFSLGQDSYHKVLSILKEQQAAFEEGYYHSDPRLPEITVRSYSPFEKVGNIPENFEQAILSFDPYGKLYSFALSFSSPSPFKRRTHFPEPYVNPSQYAKMRDLFEVKYQSWMTKAGIGENKEKDPNNISLYTPGGIGIRLKSEVKESKLLDTYRFTYLPMKNRIKTIQEDIASQIAACQKRKKDEEIARNNTYLIE